MTFYKIEAQIISMAKVDDDNPTDDATEEIAEQDPQIELMRKIFGEGVTQIANVAHEREQSRLLQTKLDLHQESISASNRFFIASIEKRELMMGAAIQDGGPVKKHLSDLLAAMGIECRDITTKEITFSAWKSLLELSSHNDFIRNERSICVSLDLENLNDAYHSYHTEFDYTESLLPDAAGIEALQKKTARLLCQSGLSPELKRIYTPAKRAAPGHPVHYVIQSDEIDVSKKITEILLSALYANKRLQSRRYSSVAVKHEKRWGSTFTEQYTELYRASEGGTVVVKLISDLPDESDVVGGDMATIESLCRIAAQFRNKTLTIFLLPRAAERLKEVLREQLDTVTLVELTEDVVAAEDARAYLQQAAREHGVRPDKALYKNLGDALKTYSVSDLNSDFRHWYDNQLKTRCYTQYADFESAGRISARKGKPRGDAYSELEKMIGLAEAKTVIKEAVNYFKAQKLFKERGIMENRPAMHMVFTGSPGTAKTTAARLFAQIMKDNGLLSVGSLVEVGRADLVGKYVGWTAPTVQKKFKEARGSVLFIDEAYSLVDDRDGCYGDEAISTIVQEMENQREDIVVIFAGYSDKMEKFLQKNPGLRSRIAFHVPFADYNEDELIQILSLMAEKQRMTIGDGVAEKLRPILAAAMKEPDFGNGRYVRNLYERAQMRQASRLLELDFNKVKKKELRLLTADDFEAISAKSSKIEKIGFTPN